MRLLLASTSKYRRMLMTQAGYDAECVAPDYEETPIAGMAPLELIAAHARGKALSVAKDHFEEIVIGSDQGLVEGSRLLGKPGSFEAAYQQLQSLRGKSAILATSLVVLWRGQMREFQNRAMLHFRKDLSDEAIAAYVRADNPIDCAGSFKIESAGPRLFSALECDDPTAIQGLPMMKLTEFIHEFWPECDLFYPNTQTGS